MKSKRLKITIGTPSATEYFHRKFIQSLMALKFPLNSEIQFSQVFGVQLPFARNHIVSEALKAKSDYIFWIDSDMIFPSDTLIRLLNHKKAIVGALAFRRLKPHYPCIFSWNEKEGCYETIDYREKKGNLIEVDATGMACILIKREVFERMKKPWFYYRDNLFSSDLTFCWNAKRKLGYKIFIDKTLKIGHISFAKVITEETYLAHLKEKKDWNKRMKKFLAKEKELYEKKKNSN